MVIITVECMNTKPHKAHSWREGFLWHRKRVCGGVPEFIVHDWNVISPNEQRMMFNYCAADVEASAALYENMPPHRHHYGFSPEKSDKVIMIWECLDPFCDHEYARFRSLFNYQTCEKNSDFRYWLWR